MEPNLIQKFKYYRRRRERREIKADFKMNDSGVNVTDMQSNDIWCIMFLILLIYDPRFVNCYLFSRSERGRRTISFNLEEFVKLFNKFLCACELDQNFCYVIKKLCKIERFEKIILNKQQGKEYYKKELSPSKHSLRDLKFYIWLLSHSKYPKGKIKLYENGNILREIDECATLASNDSLYDTSGEETHMESLVTYFQTDQQINEKVMRTGNVLSKIGRIEEEDESELDLEIERTKQNELNKKIGGDISYASEAYLNEEKEIKNLSLIHI